MNHEEFTAIYAQLMDILATVKRIDRMLEEMVARSLRPTTSRRGPLAANPPTGGIVCLWK